MSRHHRRLDYRSRERLRRACFTRDGFRCRRCGLPGQLDAHHVRPVAAGGSDELANLLTLCVRCHIAHHQADPLDPERAVWRTFVRELASR